MITNAKQTKQQYAERPFGLFNLVGQQITIEEKLPISSNPRISKKEGTAKGTQKPYSFEIAKLKVSDGVFEKDLEMSESEWLQVCSALPNGLITLQGVTLKIGRDSNTLRYKIEYIGVARQDMQGKSYEATPISGASASAPAPASTKGDQIDQYVEQLSFEMKQNGNKGADAVNMINYCKNITNGDALALIAYAKTKGAIYESGGLYKAV